MLNSNESFEHHHDLSSEGVPETDSGEFWTPDADDPAILRCQGMFNRVLSSWASDLLRLRREGLSAPGWREQVQTEEGIAWKRAA